MNKIKLTLEEIHVEKLNEQNLDKIKEFSSAVSKELDAFLKENAWNEHLIDFSKTYLFFHGNILAGYATLLTDKQQLKLDEGNPSLTQFKSKSIHEYSSVPALKIGRLCVSDNYNSQLESAKYFGLGTIIFASIIDHAKSLKEKVGCIVITTHAKKATGAYKWYSKLGFIFSFNEEKVKELLAKENVESIPMFYDINRIVK